MNNYTIDEATARRAKESYSFSDYKAGSATADYKNSVNEVYQIAEEKKLKVSEEFHERIDQITDRYARKLAAWINKKNSIDASCPSVMICGPANYPVRKHEKQMQRLHTHYEEYPESSYYISLIKKVGTLSDIIKSGDENAIEKLEIKLSKLTAYQEHMKQVNAYFRKHNTCKGCEGVDDDTAQKLDDSMNTSFRKPAPFASYTLTNNNACIKNTQERLESLKKAKAKPTEEIEQSNQYFTVIENTDIMRLQLKFEGKPSEEIRNILKSNGFKWSPNNTAWQRQLTDNAKYAVKRVITEIDKLTA